LIAVSSPFKAWFSASSTFGSPFMDRPCCMDQKPGGIYCLHRPVSNLRRDPRTAAVSNGSKVRGGPGFVIAIAPASHHVVATNRRRHPAAAFP
jgi:hypothetical protein